MGKFKEFEGISAIQMFCLQALSEVMAGKDLTETLAEARKGEVLGKEIIDGIEEKCEEIIKTKSTKEKSEKITTLRIKLFQYCEFCQQK